MSIPLKNKHAKKNELKNKLITYYKQAGLEVPERLYLAPILTQLDGETKEF